MNKQVKYKIDLRIKHIDDEDFIPYFDMDDLQLSIRKMLPDGFVSAVGKTVGLVYRLLTPH